MTRSSNLFARSASTDGVTSGRPTLDGYNDAYAAGVQTREADLRFGGQMGYAPDYTTWVNAHPYVSRPVIPILMQAPLGFQSLPNSDIWVSALRSLVETAPLSITGLNAQLDVSTDSIPFGGAGQEFDVYTNVKEQKPDITFTWAERVGMPIYRFISSWIRFLMMDPDSKYATINAIPNSSLTDMLADQYTMTMMFIEPDEAHRSVRQSWLVTNMFPKTTGPNTAKRDMASDQELRKDLAVGFTGIAQYGAGVDDVAQTLLSEIDLVGADPNARQAFLKELSGYVTDSTGNSYENTAESISPINRILSPDN